jgi:hypothetical protein
MRLRTYFFLTLIAATPAFAQRLSHPVMASRDDASLAARTFQVFPDTVRVLAVMVQFLADNDARTTGNGQFNLSTQPDSTIDPPPRNAGYFANHLIFLENYYRKVSRGKVIVQSTLVDSLFTLPTTMSTYSPAKNSSNKPVGDLARDTWTMVDASRRVQDFSRYNAFVVFHAGAGRDIDLVGILGYDPTPQDIPSLYLSLKAFQEFYGQTYAGIPVQNGTFHITNSLILPETESRPLPGATGTVLLELGINGLVCASIGNYLGLPDLFDTKTGRSGIGRFGLMDGAAIFSYSGVFPPEPSAWEKQWLGWVRPIRVGSGTTLLSLPAVGLGAMNPSRVDTIYRVPISPTEYFLVENRNRDPGRDGIRITSVLNGATRQQFFQRDTTGFNAYDIAGLGGVITDVEDFDWSLPGGVSDNVWYDGGVLLWHIDEGVISRSIAGNGVNADPTHRGVDLEEADGSQDIGQDYGSFTAGSGSEQGTALDFWYQGNESPVNTNLFSGTTFPDSRSNSGGLSHTTVKDFTARSPRMTAKVVVGDSVVTPLPGFPRMTGETIALEGYAGLTAVDVDGDGLAELLLATTGQLLSQATVDGPVQPPRQEAKMLLFKPDTSSTVPGFRKSGVVATSGSDRIAFGAAPAVLPSSTGGIPEFLIGGSGISGAPAGTMQSFSLRDSNADSLADVVFRVPTDYPMPAAPVAAESLLAYPGSTGWVKFLRSDGSVLDSLNAAEGTTGGKTFASRWKTQNSFVITAEGGNVWITSRSPRGGVTAPDRKLTVGRKSLSVAVTGSFSRGVFTAFVADGDLYLVDEQLNVSNGFQRSGIGAVAPPALADIDGDGQRDIIVFGDRRIWAFHDNGTVLDNFPVVLPVAERDTLASAPVIADVNGDALPEIVAVTVQGVVFAVDRSGGVIKGFPLQAGTGRQSVAVFDVRLPVFQGTLIGLAVSSETSGSLSAFLTGAAVGPLVLSARPWPQFQKDVQHSGLALEQLSGKPLSPEFFPASRVYNWPNPVYDGKTYLRYFVNEDARVDIMIFDLAGDLVHEIHVPAQAGLDAEVAWDVSGVQSGIYFAQVKASNASNEATKVIKIAVVK